MAPSRSRKALPIPPADEDRTSGEQATLVDGELFAADVMAGDETPTQVLDAVAGADPASSAAQTRDASRRARARVFFPGVRPGQRGDRPASTDRRREELGHLRDATRAAGAAYMESLRRSDILAPGFNDDERRTTLDGLHRVYAQAMMMACVGSLRRGLNPTSVVQAAGMMASMYMLSPDFRAHAQEYVAPVRDHLQQRIDLRARKQLAAADGDRSRLDRKWQRRLDDYEYRARGNRHLYTAESAGMTHVALAENAFRLMREPGADPDLILDSYRTMTDRLYKDAVDDGLTAEEVSRNARMVIGRRCETEPELACVFTGLADGTNRRSAPQPVQVGADGPVRELWSGEYEDAEGVPLGEGAMFSPRRRMTADDHRRQLAVVMAEGMGHAIRSEGLEAFNEDMLGYMTGWTAQQRFVNRQGVSERFGARVDQSQVMLASMAIDGLSEQSRRTAYSNAFVDALEQVQKDHPDIGAAWSRQYGENWREFMRDAVRDTDHVIPPGWSGTKTPPGPSGKARAGTQDVAAAAEGQPVDDDYQPA